MYGAVRLEQWFVLARCPAGTFIAGIGNQEKDGEAAFFVVAMSVVLGFVWAALVRRWGTLERSKTNRSMGRFWLELTIDTRNKRLAFVGGPLTAVALLVAVPIAIERPRFCLTDEAIFLRPPSFDAMQRYPWNSVVGIDSNCQPMARGHWFTSFVVTMRDGTSFDLMTAGRQTTEAYPRIVSKLKDVNFVFGYHGVEDCGAPLRDVVLHRP